MLNDQQLALLSPIAAKHGHSDAHVLMTEYARYEARWEAWYALYVNESGSMSVAQIAREGHSSRTTVHEGMRKYAFSAGIQWREAMRLHKANRPPWREYAVSNVSGADILADLSFDERRIVRAVGRFHGLDDMAVCTSDRKARNHAWYDLVKSGVSMTSIARTWAMGHGVVRSGIDRHARTSGSPKIDTPQLDCRTHEARPSQPNDETTPGFRHGRGDRLEACDRYANCVNAWATRSGAPARCPTACTGYVKIRMRSDPYQQHDGHGISAPSRKYGAA
jgi:hypothetical protein